MISEGKGLLGREFIATRRQVLRGVGLATGALIGKFAVPRLLAQVGSDAKEHPGSRLELSPAFMIHRLAEETVVHQRPHIHFVPETASGISSASLIGNPQKPWKRDSSHTPRPQICSGPGRNSRPFCTLIRRLARPWSGPPTCCFTKVVTTCSIAGEGRTTRNITSISRRRPTCSAGRAIRQIRWWWMASTRGIRWC